MVVTTILQFGLQPTKTHSTSVQMRQPSQPSTLRSQSKTLQAQAILELLRSAAQEGAFQEAPSPFLCRQAQQELSTEQRIGVDTGPGEVIQTQQIHTRTRLVPVSN